MKHDLLLFQILDETFVTDASIIREGCVSLKAPTSKVMDSPSVAGVAKDNLEHILNSVSAAEQGHGHSTGQGEEEKVNCELGVNEEQFTSFKFSKV